MSRPDDLVAEGRLDIQDVPGEISRIFFGSHEGGGRPPSYWGAGQSGGGAVSGPGGPSKLTYPGIISFIYIAIKWLLKTFQGFEDDIYLLIKLGQAALIIFIIFALFSTLFLLASCILSITNFNRGRKREVEEKAPEPFKMQV